MKKQKRLSQAKSYGESVIIKDRIMEELTHRNMVDDLFEILVSYFVSNKYENSDTNHINIINDDNKNKNKMSLTDAYALEDSLLFEYSKPKDFICLRIAYSKFEKECMKFKNCV